VRFHTKDLNVEIKAEPLVERMSRTDHPILSKVLVLIAQQNFSQRLHHFLARVLWARYLKSNLDPDPQPGCKCKRLFGA